MADVTLVSDNGPQFRLSEFEEFLKNNGITQKVSEPYNPSTNGQAERNVPIFKQGLCAMNNEPSDISQKLNIDFLCNIE
jgi:transposase